MSRLLRSCRGLDHPGSRTHRDPGVACCIERAGRSMLTPMAPRDRSSSSRDFGLGNEWVGLCHAVMSGISPREPDHRPLASHPAAGGRVGRAPARRLDAVHPRERRGPGRRRPERRQGPRGRDRDRERTHARRPRQRAPVARVGGGRRRSGCGRAHVGGRDPPDRTRSRSARPTRSAPRPPTSRRACRSNSSARRSTRARSSS